MNEINKINLSEQTKFRLSEIIGIENYFHEEINQRKSCSKKLSKYVTAFDYIDKIFIVLSPTSSGVCIISSANHCLKSAKIRAYFWSVFSRIRRDTEKYGPKITPYLDTFSRNECCWSTSWNSNFKFYANFFSNNKNNQKITKHNMKQKEKS